MPSSLRGNAMCRKKLSAKDTEMVWPGVSRTIHIPTRSDRLHQRLRAERPAGKDPLALALHVGVDAFEGGDLGGSEAVGVVGAFGATGKVPCGLKVAAARIIDKAVLQAILVIAESVNALGERREFGVRDRVPRSMPAPCRRRPSWCR